MKKISGYENIQESGSFKRLPAGGYIVRILDATDVPEKEYLKISFDVDKGEYKGFFTNEYKNDSRENKRWPNAGTFIRSYKEKALPMLKGFTTAIEKSNKNYVWDFDEKKLKNKVVGLVLADEEFVNSSGKVRTRTYVSAVRSVDVIEKGDFQVPELKRLDPSKLTSATAASAEPFVNPFGGDDSDPFASTTTSESTNEEMSNPWDDDANPFAN